MVGPATLTTAKASFAQLFDSQTREINLMDKDVFRMDDFQLYKLQGKLIDFSYKDERLSRRDRVQGWFATYWLMVHLDRTNPDAKMRRWEMMVAFSLPLEDGEIHPSIMLDLLRDPS